MNKIIGVNYLNFPQDHREILRPAMYSKMPKFQSNGSYTYAWIYKNAHQSLRTFFYSLNFSIEYQHYNYIPPNENIIVVLRDPLERWVSGLVQYLSGRVPNVRLDDDIMKICIDHTVMDLHTELQVKFLYGLKLDKCIFFYMDSNLNHNLSKFFNTMNSIPFINIGNNDPLKTKLYNFINLYLNNNPTDKSNLIKSLSLDYKLIDDIKTTTGFTNYVNHST